MIQHTEECCKPVRCLLGYDFASNGKSFFFLYFLLFEKIIKLDILFEFFLICCSFTGFALTHWYFFSIKEVLILHWKAFMVTQSIIFHHILYFFMAHERKLFKGEPTFEYSNETESSMSTYQETQRAIKNTTCIGWQSLHQKEGK